ncbi:MAG: hypothetical protein ACXWP5_16175, partial [Bdellovibrionota bacterium]
LVKAGIDQDRIWDGYNDETTGEHVRGWFEIKLAIKELRKKFHTPDYLYHLNLDRVNLDPTPDEHGKQCTDDDQVQPIHPMLDDHAVEPGLLTRQPPANPEDPNWSKLEPGALERDLGTAISRRDAGAAEYIAKAPVRDLAKKTSADATNAYNDAKKANPQDPALPALKAAMNSAKSAWTKSQNAVCNALKKKAESQILVDAMGAWIDYRNDQNEQPLQKLWASWQELSKLSTERDNQIKEVGKDTAPHVEMYDTQPESITLTPTVTPHGEVTYDIEIKNWDLTSIPGSGLDKILRDQGKETFSSHDYTIHNVSYDPIGAALAFDVEALSGSMHFDLARGLTDAADGRAYFIGLMSFQYNRVVCDRLGGVGCLRKGSAKLVEAPVNDSEDPEPASAEPVSTPSAEPSAIPSAVPSPSPSAEPSTTPSGGPSRS